MQLVNFCWIVEEKKQDGIHSQGLMPPPPPPQQCFLYLSETKSWWCEEEGEEKVSMLTQASTRDVGEKLKKLGGK